MPKHVPLRSCVVCREPKPKRELVRVVRTEDGTVAVDRTGKQNGRGSYLCPAQECWAAAQKRKALNHALQVTVSPENWEQLFLYARETLPQSKVPTRVATPMKRTARPRLQASATKQAKT